MHTQSKSPRRYTRVVARRSGVCVLLLAILFCWATVSVAGVVTLFQDDFEGDFPGPWQLSNVNDTRTDVNWGQNTYRAFDGSYSVFCAREGSFENGSTYFDSLVNYMDYNLLDLGIDLEEYSDFTLTFKAWVNTEESFDFFRVSLLEIDETLLWTNALVLTGDLSASGWQEYTVYFSDVADTTVTRFGFDFISDGSDIPAGEAGVWIDDVELTAVTDAPGIDLAIENLFVDPMALIDSTVFDSVNMDIVNYSETDLVNQDVLLTYYISENSAFGDGDDIMIGDGAGDVTIPAQTPFNINLTPQGRINMTRLWPEDLAGGSYFVFASISFVTDTLSDPNPGNSYDRTNTAVTYTVTNEYSVSIRTEPYNVGITIDGRNEFAPYTFSIAVGESFELGIAEIIPSTSGSRGRFESWDDGGERVHMVMPASDTIITATLVREHQLTMVADPDAGGSVSPADNWYPEGSSVTINATPRTGFQFVDWAGEGNGSYSGMDNPASISMDGPITQTANFQESPLQVSFTGQSVQTVPAADRTLQVQFSGGRGTVTGRVFRRLGGQSSFTSNAMSLASPGTLEFVIPESSFGPRGMEYYFEIEDADEMVRLPVGSDLYVFRTQLVNISIVTTVDEQFQMIGFPFEPSPTSANSVFDEVTDKSDEGWRFGQWNPVTETYTQYPALSSVARNNGYWLITNGGLTITASGTSSVPDNLQGNERGTEIRLQQGWNQVASPFAFDIAVSAIDFDAGIEQEFHEFVPASGSYRTVTVLHPFMGYWVYNGGANNAAIHVPYQQSGTASIADTDLGDESNGEWTVSLTAHSADRWDSNNRIGVRRDASAHYDALDCSEPPVIGTYVSLSFDTPDANGNSRSLTHDYRTATDDILAYDVTLRSNTEKPISISADLTRLPTGLKAVLVDPSSSEPLDLGASSEVTLPGVADDGVAHYKLLIGTKEQLSAESGAGATIPREFSLSQNYPNPFNAGTVITYTLITDTDIDLSIYDVLGRHVITLESGDAAPGIHRVQWDGRDTQGQAVASGMYFYRLRAGEHTDVRKMTLLK